MSQYWDRQYRFKTTASGSFGFEIGEPDAATGSSTHIKFSIEKTDGSTLNTTKIQIWNLNKNQIDTLSKENCQVELYAGYGESRPLIFKGTVSLCSQDLDGSDRIIEIDVVDGFGETKDAYISKSYKGAVEVRKIIEDIINELGMPSVFSDKAKERLLYVKYTNGYVFSGKALKALSELCTKAKLRYTIQNGVVQITKVGEPASSIVHVMKPETGLIRIPRKLYNTAVSVANSDNNASGGSGTASAFYGYEIVFLMNGAININDTVYLDTSTVKGMFRISTLKVEGDNLSGDWQCTAEIVELGG